MSRDEFDFRMEAALKDSSGYYYTRWDQAIPMTVRAENKASAWEKARTVLGEPAQGSIWALRILSIESAPIAAGSES